MADDAVLAGPGERLALVERFVGPMTVKADGTITQTQDQTKTPPAGAEGVFSSIAGERYVTDCIRAAFWRLFQQTA